jgi:signal transduction histidine kinase
VCAVCLALLLLMPRPTAYGQLDVAAVNDVAASLARDFDRLDDAEYVLPGSAYGFDYAVLDRDGRLLAATRPGLSESVTAAIAHQDTTVGLAKDGQQLGSLVIYNAQEQHWLGYQRRLQLVMVLGLLAIAGLAAWLLAVVHQRVLAPFRRLEGFAASVAAGNLDVPLAMDKGNAFGAFSESFDLMRTELAASRERERLATQSKRELVASLSHDIKTPVASIKALCETMLLTATEDRQQARLHTINAKADQIDLLISNLFHATLEELEELEVVPVEMPSVRLGALLERADYLHLLQTVEAIPECLVWADENRLSQVLDNIFNNSYKYAATKLTVTASLDDDHLTLAIADEGPGASPDELPLLTRKFYRGANAEGKDGAGLGLYLAAYFTQRMNGTLTCENTTPGLTVRLSLALV